MTFTNRITSAGFSYDAAGNQSQNNTGQSFTYDAAGRLAKVKDQNQNKATIATYTYGASNRRLITQTGNDNSTAKTYYVWGGEAVVTEYVEPSASSTMPQWSKNYIYFGSELLATEEPNGSGGELVSYHHPDGLGTRLVTNNADTTFFEQVSLPFGTALDAESTGATNRRFTSYDRSATTLLDYAVNRSYDSRQGRFTQVDPIGMGTADLSNPQSLNLYAYCGNDPINSIDPSGTWGFGITFGGFPGFPGGPGAGPGGFWSGLFNFGAGLLGSIFGGGTPHIIGSPFLAFQTPPARVGPAAPRPAIVALAGQYSPDYEADGREGSNEVFAARALESTRNRHNIMFFQNGAQIIDEGVRLSRQVGTIGRLNIFGHSYPAGVIGFNNNSEGLYIGDPGNLEAYHRSYTFHDGRQGLIPYVLSAETRRRGADSAENFVQAIVSGEINIANGGEIVFYGCFTDAIASHVAWILGDNGRSDIRVTGSNGSVSMARPGYAFTWGAWQWNTYAGRHWLGTKGKRRMRYR